MLKMSASKSVYGGMISTCFKYLLRQRANARNVSFRISLWWPNHIINSVDKTKLSWNTPTASYNFQNIAHFLRRMLQVVDNAVFLKTIHSI